MLPVSSTSVEAFSRKRLLASMACKYMILVVLLSIYSMASIAQCSLDVSCPELNDTEDINTTYYQCLTAVPACASDEISFNALDASANINDYCGPLSIVCADETFGVGCNGATLRLERTYTVTDDGTGESIQCVTNYYVKDETEPIFDNCPTMPLIVECGQPFDTIVDDWLNAVTATDNCSSVTIGDDYNKDDLQEICSSDAEGLIVNFTARDFCGNTSFCQGEIRLEDRQAPAMVDCPEIPLTLECGNDNTFAISNWLSAVSAVDLCDGPVSVTNDFDPLNLAPVCFGVPGGLIVNFTATDQCGNASSCQGEIRLEDTLAPSLSGCPSEPLLVECGVNSDQQISSWLASVSASDLCEGGITVNNDYNAANLIPGCGFGGVPPLVVNFTAIDFCGNSASCQGEIRMDDTTAPTIENCPTEVLVLECGEDNTQIVNDWLNAVTASDFCEGSANVFNDYSAANLSANCPGAGVPLDITFTAADFCGNSDTCPGQILVEDTQPPVFSGCPSPPLVLECGEDNDQAIADWLASVTANDLCEGAVAVSNDYDSANLQAICSTDATGLIVTFTTTDSCGNQDTCQGEIRLEDTVAPILADCPVAPLMLECGLNNDQAIADWLAAVTANDLCEGLSPVSNDYDALNLLPICPADAQGLIVTFTTSDSCGNEATCQGEIRLEDTLAPVLSDCPAAPLVLECGADNDAVINAWLSAVSASDACDGGVSVNNDFDPANLVPVCAGDPFALVVTFTSTDDCGNAATCEGQIRFEDTLAPVLSNCPPASLDLECGVDNEAAINTWLASVTATDLCEGGVVVGNDFDPANLLAACGPGAGLVVNFTAQDLCGNQTACQGTINLLDNAGPSMSGCPVAPLVLECGNDNTQAIDDWLALVTASDLCDGALTVNNDFDPANLAKICTTDPSGLIVNFSTADACGNPATCQGEIRLVDTTAPVLSACPVGPLMLQCGADNTQTINDWINAVTATDLCDGLLAVSNDFDAANLLKVCTEAGAGLLVNFSAADACGNTAACQGEIKLIDSLPPDLSGCPAGSLVLECGADNDQAIADWIAAVTANDQCDGATPVLNDFDPLNLTSICTGDASGLVVNFTSSDACGNTSTCQGEIRLEDTSMPVLDGCPVAPLEIECGIDPSAAISAWLATVSATDGCGGAIPVNNDYNAANLGGPCDQPPTDLTVNFSAVDACGNIATCQGLIVVIDSDPPALNACPTEPLYLECGVDYDASIAAWLGTVQGLDSCLGAVAVSNDYDSANLPQAEDPDGLLVTFTAEDQCGNQEVCEAVIIVLDTAQPVLINCPTEPLEIQCGEDVDAAVDVWLDDVTATDVCLGLVVVTTDYDRNNLELIGPNDNGLEITFTAVDENGNEQTCTGEIQYVDKAPPTFDQITLPTTPITVSCSQIPTAAGLTATDECSGEAAEVAYSTTTENDICPGSYNLKRTWTTTDIFGNEDNYVQDITVITTVGPAFNEILPGDITVQCGVVPAAPSLTADGECTSATVDFEEITTNTDCGYQLERIWTAVDECSGETEHRQLITVEDNEAPQMAVAPVVSVDVEAGTCQATNVSLNLPDPTDNCDASPTVIVTRTDNLAMTDPFPTGCTTVEVTVTDDCGNTLEESTEVCVLDAEIPTFDNCPQNIYTCDGMATWNMPTVQDNCAAMITDASSTSGTVFPEGETEVVLTSMDAAGNTNTCTFYVIYDPIALDVEVSDYDGYGTRCEDSNDGFAIAQASGGAEPYTYNWDTGQSGSSITDLPPGTYNVEVVDNAGCTALREVIITQPNGMFVLEDIEEIMCGDGMIAMEDEGGVYDLSPTGGSAPYAYEWSSDVAGFIDPGTAVISELQPGTYNYTVTDADGCTSMGSYTFVQPEAITFYGFGLNPTEGFQGNILPVYYNAHVIEIDGGSGDYTYDWDRTGYVRYEIDNEFGVSGETLTIIYADDAEWVVTVYDDNGCSSGELVFTNDSGYGGGNPSVSDEGTILDIDDFTIVGENQSSNTLGSIDINVVGGVPPYTYLWDGPGDYSQGPMVGLDMIDELEYGLYEVTVTDAAFPPQVTEGFYWVPLDRHSGRLKSPGGDLSVQANPNPISASSNITAWSAQSGEIQLELLDYQGRQIAILAKQLIGAGQVLSVSLKPDEYGLSAGLYVIMLVSENQEATFTKVIVAD